MNTAADYAEGLEQATAEAFEFASSLSAEEWSMIVPGEEWPVGVVVHHVALGYDLVIGWLDCAVGGRPIEQTGEDIDADNLRHSVEYVGVGIEETIDLLRRNGRSAAARIRELGDTDLATTTPFGPAGGAPLSIEQYCNAAIGHVQRHIANARAAVSGQA